MVVVVAAAAAADDEAAAAAVAGAPTTRTRTRTSGGGARFCATAASALTSWVLAPALLSQGILAGLAAYEMLAANADITSRPTRAYCTRVRRRPSGGRVGLGLASLIGGVVRRPRWRSGQYTVQPWRRLLDRLNILIYFAVVMLSFAVRQLAWAMDSPVTVERLPW